MSLPAPGPKKLSKAANLFRDLFREARSPAFRDYTRDLLVELCRVDTTPKPDPAEMRAVEARCFHILQREIGNFPFASAQLERRPVNPAIEKHPHFSLLHFTKTPARPEGLPATTTYAGRSNLVFTAPGSRGRAAGKSIALNAHIDVVAPYFPPKVRGGTVFGRGACDDKGPVVAVTGALKVLSAFLNRTGLTLNRNVVAMFVVEEETGGNGSLSLALDHELREAYDSVLVCECTGLRFHPANRGAVWYRATLNPPAGVAPLEMFAFVNEEMEKEGAAIRAESEHKLFPQRPVQTCHGIIGQFGEHPSRICARVAFEVSLGRRPNPKMTSLVRDCLEAGLATYVGLYGDKTKVKDPATGQAMVPCHYELRPNKTGFVVTVYGAAGHMGAIRERDGAVTKAAHLVRSLVFSKQRLECLANTAIQISLHSPEASRGGKPPRRAQTAHKGRCETSGLVLEGGQGFVPTHTMQEVMARLRCAAQRGAEHFLRRLGRTDRGCEVVTVVYEKLHNEAFDGDPNSVSVKNAICAARSCGIWKDEPVLGWTVSCDARLFASQYPELDVLTFGPGRLLYAHSDQEQIDLKEIRQAVEFLATFLLLQTGTVVLD